MFYMMTEYLLWEKFIIIYFFIFREKKVENFFWGLKKKHLVFEMSGTFISMYRLRTSFWVLECSDYFGNLIVLEMLSPNKSPRVQRLLAKIVRFHFMPWMNSFKDSINSKNYYFQLNQLFNLFQKKKASVWNSQVILYRKSKKGLTVNALLFFQPLNLFKFL